MIKNKKYIETDNEYNFLPKTGKSRKSPNTTEETDSLGLLAAKFNETFSLINP